MVARPGRVLRGRMFCRCDTVPCQRLDPPGSPRVAQPGTERHGNSNRRDDFIARLIEYEQDYCNDMHAGIIQWQRETLMLRRTEGESVGVMRGGRELDQ